jgi:hypothetical protein
MMQETNKLEYMIRCANGDDLHIPFPDFSPDVVASFHNTDSSFSLAAFA